MPTPGLARCRRLGGEVIQMGQALLRKAAGSKQGGLLQCRRGADLRVQRPVELASARYPHRPASARDGPADNEYPAGGRDWRPGEDWPAPRAAGWPAWRNSARDMAGARPAPSRVRTSSSARCRGRAWCGVPRAMPPAWKRSIWPSWHCAPNRFSASCTSSGDLASGAD